MLKELLACVGVIAVQAGTAQAAYTTSAPYMTGSFAITVVEGLHGGNGFATTSTSPFADDHNTATASFTYTGALNFNNTAAQNAGRTGDLNSSFGFNSSNISNYSGAGDVSLRAGSGYNINCTTVANYAISTTPGTPRAANFLASSGSASDYQYASWYKIDLGKLAAGTILDITHDDGISVYQGNEQINPTVSGPTTVVTDQVTLGASQFDTFVYYSRQNGTPSVLQIDVPEPASVALLTAGLIGVWAIGRRRKLDRHGILEQIQPG